MQQTPGIPADPLGSSLCFPSLTELTVSSYHPNNKSSSELISLRSSLESQGLCNSQHHPYSSSKGSRIPYKTQPKLSVPFNGTLCANLMVVSVQGSVTGVGFRCCFSQALVRLGGTSAMHHSGTKVNLSNKAIRQFLKPFRHEVMFECGNFSPLLLLICIHLSPGKQNIPTFKSKERSR